MDPTARFESLVQGPDPAIPLDELALLVAAHADPDLDVDHWLGALDDVALRTRRATFAGVIAHLEEEGFTGNHTDYYDPSNSYLDRVLERRTGIPITLSIVAIEVGRRVGVPMVGIGMPGHFLVRDGGDPDAFADPFTARVLHRDQCRQLFNDVHGDMAFDETFLAPTGTRAIAARLLANLKGIYLARRDRRALAWVLALRLAIPGAPIEEHRELAAALSSDGQFLQAAAVLDRLAELGRAAGHVALVDEAEREADRLRARLN